MRDDPRQCFKQTVHTATCASHAYYRAVLWGASSDKRRRLMQAWFCAIQRQWPDLSPMELCQRCRQQKSRRCVLHEDRLRMIAEAAYYRAEHRGFKGGQQINDWLEAESEIDRRYFPMPESLRSLLLSPKQKELRSVGP